MKADPKGRVWFGSSVDDGIHEASGNLFCLENGKVTVKQADTKISNGLAWSSDRKKFYFSDTLQYAVFEYDYDLETGAISNRKVLFKPEEGRGLTDGMCIDSEDNLWVAFWGGSRIEQRSTKNGSLLAFVNVPAKNVMEVDLNENILVQGIIDLYYINKHDELVLLDYKTDFAKPGDEEILKDRHKEQLMLYKQALESGLERKVDRVYIYSTGLGKEISLM